MSSVHVFDPGPAPRERPILFSGPMVRAILHGRKTQTRRIVQLRSDEQLDGWSGLTNPPLRAFVSTSTQTTGYRQIRCPYGYEGTRLWIRETFAGNVPGCESQGGYSYRADHVDPRGDGPANPMRWKPAIHMPRRASRILLEIISVRVERIQGISESDAQAEGVDARAAPGPLGYRERFRELWDQINAKRARWSSNPWVFVISFKRVPS